MIRLIRRSERGMILVNVLVIVMLATLVLAIILAGEDSNSERSQRLRDAAQAMATARGAELSAVTALRRDLAGGSRSDTQSEPWAKIGDRNVAIAGGRFSFAVADAQAKFNINSLVADETWPRATLANIVAAASIDADATNRISDLVKKRGPVSEFADLQEAGLTYPELARLAQLCTVLPEPTPVNFNTAPEALVAVMLNNPATAHSVITLRAQAEGLTQADLLAGGIIMPQGTGITSDYFWAHARVTIGSTAQQLTSLIHRRFLEGKPRVETIRRWRGRAPLQAPALL